MERGPFLDERVQEKFGRFVGIVLHTDGKDDKYFESSQRNIKLQVERFEQRALPYYVLLDPTGTTVYWKGAGVFTVDDVLAALDRVPASFEKP